MPSHPIRYEAPTLQVLWDSIQYSAWPQYAFTSQTQKHGLNPATAVIELAPRAGEYTLREDDILDAITQHGHEIALVMFSGVQYYTGQWFPMESVTRKSREIVRVCIAQC
jgi:kynureninase